jgi:hypothetical protein
MRTQWKIFSGLIVALGLTLALGGPSSGTAHAAGTKSSPVTTLTASFNGSNSLAGFSNNPPAVWQGVFTVTSTPGTYTVSRVVNSNFDCWYEVGVVATVTPDPNNTGLNVMTITGGFMIAPETYYLSPGDPTTGPLNFTASATLTSGNQLPSGQYTTYGIAGTGTLAPLH